MYPTLQAVLAVGRLSESSLSILSQYGWAVSPGNVRGSTVDPTGFGDLESWSLWFRDEELAAPGLSEVVSSVSTSRLALRGGPNSGRSND